MKYLIFIILFTLSSVAAAAADEIPYWVLDGIMRQETKSHYVQGPNGEETINYVDRRVGAAGELSAFQIKRCAWEQVKRPGDRFEDLATDQAYAERVAMDYLLWLYHHAAHKSWPQTVQMYHRGPGKRSYKYYRLVVIKAKKDGYNQ